MAIYDNYNLRFNTANQLLEMNTGGETWIPVPDTIAPGELVLANTQILVGQGSGLAGAVTLSGGATIANTGVLTLGNTAVTGQVLTGYVSGAGTVSATDTILTAVNKLNGNTAAVSTVANAALPKAGGTMTGGFFIADQSATRGLLQFGAGATYLDGDSTLISYVINGQQRFYMSNGVFQIPTGGALALLSGGFGSGTVVRIDANGVVFPSFTTTNRDAIASPTEGQTITNSTTHKLNVYLNGAWEAITSA